MKNIIITTTNSIENCPVVKYLDFACANIVLGTNIFSDISASFTDFFGGKSKTYQNKLELIQKDVISALKDKARDLGANAILSCRIDFDEISGGGKSMFMVSASGTACVLDLSRLPNDSVEVKSGEIPNSVFLIEKTKEYILLNFEKYRLIQDSWVDFLMEYPQDELIDPLIDKYIQYQLDPEYNEQNIIKTKKILSRVDRNATIQIAYSLLAENKKAITSLINEMELFSAKNILDLCKKGSHDLVYDILNSYSPYYNEEDLSVMKDIVNFYELLPDTGKIENIKGVFGKESQKFICQNGHKSSVDSIFCENENCQINVKGIHRFNVALINEFKNKVRILTSLINK